MTQVALCLAAFRYPGEVRVDVGFAPGAAERAILAEVYCGDLTETLRIIILCRLR